MNANESIIASLSQTGRILCPECSGERKKKDPTLVVTVYPDRRVFKCHHCEYEGIIPTKNIADYTKEWKEAEAKKIIAIPTQLNQDTDVIREWFRKRGVIIDNKTVLPNMTTGVRYYRNTEENLPSIGFIYGPKDDPNAIKWRPLEGKHFTQQGASREFYGLENI